MSLVVDFGEKVGVYPMPHLIETGPANDIVAGVPIVVVVAPDSTDDWSVFHRVVDDRVLDFVVSDGKLVDTQTRTVWDPGSGRALEGALAGEILDNLPGFNSFEADAGHSGPVRSTGKAEDIGHNGGRWRSIEENSRPGSSACSSR